MVFLLARFAPAPRPLKKCCFQTNTLRNQLYLLHANFEKVRNSKVSHQPRRVVPCGVHNCEYEANSSFVADLPGLQP